MMNYNLMSDMKMNSVLLQNEKSINVGQDKHSTLLTRKVDWSSCHEEVNNNFKDFNISDSDGIAGSEGGTKTVSFFVAESLLG
jgi:hypothetical protein